jgi:predicted metal-dependent phosphoesterase TrpH
MLFFSMRFDLHVHSHFSKDSNADIDSIITHAKKNGLDGIAICDHDTIEGGIACAKRAKEIGTDLIVISGVEVTSSKGHILSRCLDNSSNSKAKKAAESQNLPQVGGSDAHTPQMVGQAYTEIDAQENTVDAVLMAIRQGKVRAGGKKTPISLVIKQMFVGFGRKTIRQL